MDTQDILGAKGSVSCSGRVLHVARSEGKPVHFRADPTDPFSFCTFVLYIQILYYIIYNVPEMCLYESNPLMSN